VVLFSLVTFRYCTTPWPANLSGLRALFALANAAGRGLTDGRKVLARWEGVSDNVSIKLNTDYDVVHMSVDDIMMSLQPVGSITPFP